MTLDSIRNSCDVFLTIGENYEIGETWKFDFVIFGDQFCGIVRCIHTNIRNPGKGIFNSVKPSIQGKTAEFRKNVFSFDALPTANVVLVDF